MVAEAGRVDGEAFEWIEGVGLGDLCLDLVPRRLPGAVLDYLEAAGCGLVVVRETDDGEDRGVAAAAGLVAADVEAGDVDGILDVARRGRITRPYSGCGVGREDVGGGVFGEGAADGGELFAGEEAAEALLRQQAVLREEDR
jgi:hypothetical protein